MTTKKQYLELKKELIELQEYELANKLVDLYFETKREEYSKGLDFASNLYKK